MPRFRSGTPDTAEPLDATRTEKMKTLITIILISLIGNIEAQITMTNIDTLYNSYLKKLNDVRSNTNLLNNYSFHLNKSNHYERLKLNIALANDFNRDDYHISKYLFEQEFEWRKSQNYFEEESGEVDNLYFSALVLSRYNQPETIIKFIQTKSIDFDSQIGFDSEYLFTNGITNTYEYALTCEEETKELIYKQIGNDAHKSGFSEEDIENWKGFKHEYFENYMIPVKNEMWFLYSVKEKEVLQNVYEKWVIDKKDWTIEDVHKYITYSKYLSEKSHLVNAHEMKIELENKPIEEQPYRYYGLIKAYSNNNNPEGSLKLITQIIPLLERKNQKRQLIEIACNTVLENPHAKESETLFEIIKRETKEHGFFSQNIDELIIEIEATMK